jgi:flagellar motor component MotA
MNNINNLYSSPGIYGLIDPITNELRYTATKAAKFHNMTISTICRLVSGQMKTSSTGISFRKI